MTKIKSVSQIINEIGSDNLNLYRGNGYWYFLYDSLVQLSSDQHTGEYADLSVPVMYLNDMELSYWVQIGKDFVAQVEAGTYQG